MTKHDTIAELSIRVARAEMERDAAVKRAELAEEKMNRAFDMARAVTSGDKERILKTLEIIGIPAQDLADIYAIEQEWHANGGNQSMLDEWRKRKAKSA